MTEQHKPPEDAGFPPEILTQPMAAKLAYFQNKLIAHPLLKDAYDKLLHTIYYPAGSSIIWVVGPTGVGKTTLLRKTVKQMIENARQDMVDDPGFLPLVSVGLQDVSAERGIFDWKDFFKCLLRAQNEPLIENKINYDPSLGPLQKSLRRTSTLADLRGAVKECFRNRRPRVIFLDEAQHFKKVGSGYSYKNQMDNIKSLAEMTNAIYVLVGTYELLDLTRLSGQLCRRSTQIHLPRYRCEKPADLEAFINMLMMFQRSLPLPKAPNLVDHYEYFYDGCVGCIGVLKDWLQSALGEALEDNAKTLTMPCLKRHEKSVHDLMNMLLEIDKGERFLAESKKDRDELHRLLGWKTAAVKKQKTGGTERSADQETPTQEQASQQSQPKQKKGRVGQRKEKRDRVENGKKSSAEEMKEDGLAS